MATADPPCDGTDVRPELTSRGGGDRHPLAPDDRSTSGTQNGRILQRDPDDRMLNEEANRISEEGVEFYSIGL